MNCAKRNLQLPFAKTKKALLSAAPFFLRSLISHKNEHTARRPRALEVECVKKTFQWNCAPKRATGSFPASCESKCAARSLSRQAHQTKKALFTWCLPYPGALEVECVKKTFQWNCAPKRATGSFPASCESKCAARSLSRQAHQTKKALFTWCLPYPGALEVECVKKTFQWNCAPKRATGSFPASCESKCAARSLSRQARQKKKDTAFAVSFSFGALEGTRTPDLLVRSQSLYPAELQAHPVWCCFQSAYL